MSDFNSTGLNLNLPAFPKLLFTNYSNMSKDALEAKKLEIEQELFQLKLAMSLKEINFPLSSISSQDQYQSSQACYDQY